MRICCSICDKKEVYPICGIHLFFIEDMLLCAQKILYAFLFATNLVTSKAIIAARKNTALILWMMPSAIIP